MTPRIRRWLVSWYGRWRCASSGVTGGRRRHRGDMKDRFDTAPVSGRNSVPKRSKATYRLTDASPHSCYLYRCPCLTVVAVADNQKIGVTVCRLRWMVSGQCHSATEDLRFTPEITVLELSMPGYQWRKRLQTRFSPSSLRMQSVSQKCFAVHASNFRKRSSTNNNKCPK